MSASDICNLASKLTEKEINNVLNSWDNCHEQKYITEFNTLVKLGDSKELSMATVLDKKYEEKEESELYNLFNI